MSDHDEGVAFLAKDEKGENGVERAVAAADEGLGEGGGVLACSDGSTEVASQQNFEADTGEKNIPLSGQMPLLRGFIC